MTRPQTVIEAWPCRVCKQYPVLEPDKSLDRPAIRVVCAGHSFVVRETRDGALKAWNYLQGQETAQ